MEAFWSVTAFLVIVGIAIFGLIGQRPVNKIVAYLALNPEAMTKITRAIEDEFQDHDFEDKPDEAIEDEIDERTKHVVGRMFSEIWRGQPFEVTKKTAFDPSVEWPKVKTIVRDSFVLIRVKLGHSLMGKHAVMKPASVRIKRHGVIKLDTRRPISEAFAEPYTPPAKVATAKAAPPANPSPPPAKAPEKPVSEKVRRQLK